MKRTAYIFWLVMGLFVIALLSQALDVGDDSECSTGEYIQTVGGVWACVNVSTSNSNGDNDRLYINIGSSGHKDVFYKLYEYEENDTIIHVRNGRHFIFGGTLE